MNKLHDGLAFAIPAFGEAPYLEETLQSLIHQNQRCPITVRWVRRPATRSPHLPTEVSLIETDQARGIAGDWQAALEGSRTLWTTLAHADDLYSAEYAAAVMKAAQRFPEAGIIFTDVEYQDPRLSHLLLNWFKQRINPASRWRLLDTSKAEAVKIPSKTMARALKWGCFIPCPTAAYRQDLASGLFREDYRTALDWKAWLDLARSGVDFVYIPRKLVQLRIHAEATTQLTLQNGVRATEEHQIIQELWGPGMARVVQALLRFGQKLQQITPVRSKRMEQTQMEETQESFSDSELSYLHWLKQAERKTWRRYIDVQIPYRWNLRRLNPGRVLDIGAGIGRNLSHLQRDSVGLEINRAALGVLRSKGLNAYHPDEFKNSPEAKPQSFDSILLSHVAEHMTSSAFHDLIAGVQGYLRPQGKLIVICPQEKGYATDSTHVEFMDHDKILKAMAPLGFREMRRYSFPFPRWVGKHFTHNEFVSVLTK